MQKPPASGAHVEFAQTVSGETQCRRKMVKLYGKDKAEELLKQCRAELR